VRGLSFKEGVDYKETFSPVSRYAYTRAIIFISSVLRWRIHYINVKTHFLNEIIEEQV
jgi:hypothetical protein